MNSPSSSPADSFLSTDPSLTASLNVDNPHNLRAITKEDLQTTAWAIASVFELAGIPYAFCGGWEMVNLMKGEEGRMTDDLDCIVGKGFGVCTHAILASADKGFEIGGHLSDGVQRIRYTVPHTAPPVTTTIDLLRAGEFGPRDLKAPNRTVVLADNLTYLSPTELLRAKVKAFAARGGEKDKMDILWLIKECGEVLDGERIDPGGELSGCEDTELREAWGEWVRTWSGWEGDEEDEEDGNDVDSSQNPDDMLIHDMEKKIEEMKVADVQQEGQHWKGKGHVGFRE